MSRIRCIPPRIVRARGRPSIADLSVDREASRCYISRFDEMMATPLTEAVEIHKALGHPVRLRILAMLSDGELCVCQMNAVIGLAPSTISAHLSDLRRAGLIVERKEGRFVSFRHADDEKAQRLLAAVLREIARDPQVEADARLIRGVRRVPVEDLCRVDLDLDRVGLGKLAAAARRA